MSYNNIASSGFCDWQEIDYSLDSTWIWLVNGMLVHVKPPCVCSILYDGNEEEFGLKHHMYSNGTYLDSTYRVAP